MATLVLMIHVLMRLGAAGWALWLRINQGRVHYFISIWLLLGALLFCRTASALIVALDLPSSTIGLLVTEFDAVSGPFAITITYIIGCIGISSMATRLQAARDEVAKLRRRT